MKYLSYFILFFILHSLKADAVTFQKVTTVQEIEAHLQKSCNSKTLVIFDVDYVLIAPKDKIFRFCGEQDDLRRQLFNHLQASTVEKNKILNGKKIPLYDHLMSIIINTSEYEAVDPLMANLIAKLQKQNVKVIALTQNQSGPLADIPSQSDKKIKDLKKIGIDFNNSFFNLDFIIINSVSSKNGLHPVYDRGVIFTNGVKKGDALKAFLISQNFKPGNVIFIDDRQEYLESVDSALKTMEIPYLGLQFTQLSERNERVDKALAKYQYDYLLEQEIWLNDAQALEMQKCLQKNDLDAFKSNLKLEESYESNGFRR